MPLTEDLLAPGSLFGHYRIEGPIGSGGMGTVYRATNLALDSLVAIKVIRPDVASDSEARQRFDRERKLAAKLKHPHIVRTLDGGEQDLQPYVVMDVIDGVDLQTLIRPDPRRAPQPLDPKAAVTVISQVGTALDEAHRLGMIHRDVKPANILIAERGAEPWAYLTDFGLARLAEATPNMALSFGFRSGTGQLLGTPYYMSPEQTRGVKDIDRRTDIWSLGAVLYAILTGEVPYRGESWYDLARAIVDDPFPPLSDRVPASQALNAVLARAMAKRPQDRFESAGDLGRAALDAVASPGAAPPAPTPGPARGPAPISEREMAERAAALLRRPAATEEPLAGPAAASAADELAREMAARAAAALLQQPAERQLQASETPRDVSSEAAQAAAAALAAESAPKVGGGESQQASPEAVSASVAEEAVKRLAQEKLAPKVLKGGKVDDLIPALAARLEPDEALLNLTYGFPRIRDPYGLWALTNRRLLYVMRKGQIECREWHLTSLSEPARLTWTDELRVKFGSDVIKLQPGSSNKVRHQELMEQINAIYQKDRS